ncbi:MAG: hypothetical protein QOH35_3054 [Acidobacteriaceae bacterium]|nr:hypothetical protein [Acidobacteriaceae bacterium]
MFPIEGEISGNHKSVSFTDRASICGIAVPNGWITRDSLKSSRNFHCDRCLKWSHVFEKLGEQPQSLMRITS